MRGPVLALLVGVSVLLSGCILSPGTPERTESAALLPELQLLAAPPSGTHAGVLGFWVPENATDLSIRWTQDARDAFIERNRDTAASLPTDRQLPHGPGARGPLGHFPDLLVVLDPDGERLYVGTPAARIFGANGTDDLPRAVIHQAADPAPGAYRIILHGHLPPPKVHYTLIEGTEVADLTPLPLQVERIPLLVPDGPEPLLLQDEGTFTPPEGTLAVWGSMHGTGGAARLTLTTPDAPSPTFFQERRVLADPSQIPVAGVTFGLDQVLERWEVDPSFFTPGPVQWELTGTAFGYAYAYAAVTGVLDPPFGHLEPSVAPGAETTEMEGRIERWTASSIDLPGDAGVTLRLAHNEQSATDHATYRIYDETGTRLHWGATANETRPIALPAGRVVILNDGPGALELVVHGPAPAEATLARLPTRTETIQTSLGQATGGADETTVRTIPSGPTIHIQLDSIGTLSDLHVSIHDDAELQRATIPNHLDRHPRDPFCCALPFFGSHSGDPHWLDPGIHHVRFQSADGEGDVFLGLEMVDLTALARSDTNGK